MRWSVIEAWTGEIIGEMHNNEISYQQLANKLGWHVKYLSAVMNGKRNPAEAEAKVRIALRELLEEKRKT